MTDFVRHLGVIFPRLTDTNHQITHPADPDYNCIAWANSDTGNWWAPGRFWPSKGPAGTGNEFELLNLFADQGFVQCDAADPVDGYELVALYSDGSGFWKHAARRLAGGRWSSKMGKAEVITHDTPADVGGGVYGEVFAYMKRPLPPS